MHLQLDMKNMFHPLKELAFHCCTSNNWLLTLYFMEINKTNLNWIMIMSFLIDIENNSCMLYIVHLSYVTQLFWHFCKDFPISYGKTIFTSEACFFGSLFSWSNKARTKETWSEVAIFSHYRKTTEKLANISFNPLPIKKVFTDVTG